MGWDGTYLPFLCCQRLLRLVPFPVTLPAGTSQPLSPGLRLPILPLPPARTACRARSPEGFRPSLASPGVGVGEAGPCCLATANETEKEPFHVLLNGQEIVA